MTGEFVRVCAASELSENHGLLVEHQGRAVALFRHGGGVIALERRAAPDNAGLETGTIVNDCVIDPTSGWRYRLADGECIFGDEDLTPFRARVSGDTIEVDFTPRDTPEMVARESASVARALEEDHPGRLIRSVMRLLALGSTPADVAAIGVVRMATRAPFGLHHGVAATSDCLKALGVYQGPERAIPLVVALSLSARGTALHHAPVVVTPLPASAAPGAADKLYALRQTLAAGDGVRAEAIVAAAFRDGVPAATIGRWLSACAGDGFRTLGQGLIFAHKAVELVAALGDAVAPDVFGAATRRIAVLAREDHKPAMRGFVRRLAVIGEDLLDRLESGAFPGVAELDDDDEYALLETLLGGAAIDGCQRIHNVLVNGAALEAVVSVLARAATQRILRYDPAGELRADAPTDLFNLMHVVAYVAACRHTARFDPAAAMRAMLFAAHFIHRERQPDELELSANIVLRVGTHPSIAAIEHHIAAREVDDAVSAVRAYLRQGGADVLESLLLRHAIEAPLADPYLHGLLIQSIQTLTVQSRLDFLRRHDNAWMHLAAAAKLLAVRARGRDHVHRVGRAIAQLNDRGGAK